MALMPEHESATTKASTHGGEIHSAESSGAAPAHPGPYRVSTNSTALNLRSAPHIDPTTVIGQIPHGSRVDVIDSGNYNGFFKVRALGHEGYAFARYLAQDSHGPAADAVTRRILEHPATTAPTPAAASPAPAPAKPAPATSSPASAHVEQAAQPAAHTELSAHAEPVSKPATAPAAASTSTFVPPGSRQVKHPEQYPTYEEWIADFAKLSTFEAEGFDVVGEAATASSPAPKVHGRAGEDQITHPADAWIRANLPEELRQTAFMLPADCADMAVILRHVYLVAHGRTEKYGEWVIGAGAGATVAQRQAAVDRLIELQVSSANVKNMVAPYCDESGKPLRKLKDLAPMLHPGDILVWEHHDESGRRTGGHTDTIQTINRDGDTITEIVTLKGNQPLSGKYGDLPGRRIEHGHRDDSSLIESTGGVWGWVSENTTLVVAGPPAAAPRPPAKRDAKGHPRRSIEDWSAAVASADRQQLVGVVEAMLHEARGLIEGKTAPLTHGQMTALGQQVAARAKAFGDAATVLKDIEQMARALAAGPATAAAAVDLKHKFDAFLIALVPASTV
jgi:hypothetical protein